MGALLARTVEMTKRTCASCAGVGRVIDPSENAPQVPVVEGEDLVFRAKSLLCERCGGLGCLDRSPTDRVIAAAVATAVLQNIALMRDNGLVHEMNELIDWGADYANAFLQAVMDSSEFEDAAADALEALTGEPRASAQAHPNTHAMTREELTMLGIEPE